MKQGKPSIPLPTSEAEYRKNLLRFAEKSGGREAVRELQCVFDKWDAILPLAPPDERKEMARMAVLEVERLLSIHSEIRDGLTINGEIVIPGRPGWRNG